ncbi:hypothetical protein RIF29_03656 [Crotalaria pallida]|uniref:Uncharacterized protein n=1 Tax=Crotalaria pallida TaxID=3830 RepID=A0AAN9J062_CROPI
MEDTQKPCGHQPLLPSLNPAIVVHVRHRHMTPIVFTKLRKRLNQSSFSFKLAAAKQPLVQICIHTVVPPSGACHHSRQQPTVAMVIAIASKFYRRIDYLGCIMFAMVTVLCVQGRHRQTTTVNNPYLCRVL